MRDAIEKNIRDNIKNYAILGLFLLLGLILGIIFMNNLSNESKGEINTYYNSFINEIKNDNKINYFNLLKSNLSKNLKLIIILTVFNFSIWGGIINLGLIGYKGFTLGYSISSAIAILGVGKGIIFSLSLILFGEIIYIPILFFIIVASSNTYKEIINYNLTDNKIKIAKFLVIFIFTIIMAVVISLLETYLNSNLFIMCTKYF